MTAPATARVHDREIVRLAVPAFLALVAEPLFLLTDAAIVGHLGTAQLAGQGIAAVVLHTAIGLCIFLAYGTTASVARHLGAGDSRGALTRGVDGIWLAITIGMLVTVLGVVLTEPLIGAFGAGAQVEEFGATYLRIAWLGTTPALVMLAATGVLRGLQDTRTPLVVAIMGNGVNVVLNLVLVFGIGSFDGLGIAGSAIGTVIAQSLSAAALLGVIVRGTRREGASLRPDLAGIREAARAGVALVIRTLTLRAALLATTYAVTLAVAPPDRPGALATHQIAITVWSFMAFVLDAIAIAAQALTGRYLGAGDTVATQVITRRMVRWGAASGVICGVLLAAAAPWLGRLFTDDSEVHKLLVPVMLVAALGQPVAGVVFVLDGVLIGAGDGRYLAAAGLAALCLYLPALALAASVVGGLAAVWVSFAGVFMGARFAVLTRRARGTRWLVTGVTAPARSR